MACAQVANTTIRVKKEQLQRMEELYRRDKTAKNYVKHVKSMRKLLKEKHNIEKDWKNLKSPSNHHEVRDKRTL